MFLYPISDFTAQLIEPRNQVIHRADFANEERATQAVKATDELSDPVMAFSMGENLIGFLDFSPPAPTAPRMPGPHGALPQDWKGSP